MEPDSQIVVLSDIHLGTDVPTAWYQRDVHEPVLHQILRWVTDHAEAVRELVLLGDIVDFWTYPIDQVPPTFADIVAAHPATFGLDGALAACLDALGGRVTYVPGNHDMGVTAADAASIRSRGGHAVRFHDALPYVPAPGIAMAHGHHYTLCNAPDTVEPWAPLPLGYFVTRAVATQWARTLPDGRTVADLADQGAPNGIDLRRLVATAGGLGSRSVTGTLVDYVATSTGVDKEEPILMPDGSSTTLAQVRTAYADSWTRWASQGGRGLAGHAQALKATLADFDGSYLGWFAQKLALEHDADLVVMGHTHEAIGGLDQAMVQYVNAGFECPSKPDRSRPDAPHEATFVVAEIDSASAEVWTVPVEGACHPTKPPRTRVVHGPTRDLSCYVTIDNIDGLHDLELVSHTSPNGTYVVEPPSRIAAGDEGRFWLQDDPGRSGTKGSVTYRSGHEELDFRFSCPALGANTCSERIDFSTKVGDGSWGDDRIARWGHPFFVAFQVR